MSIDPVYSTTAPATVGRDGTARTATGDFKVKLAPPT